MQIAIIKTGGKQYKVKENDILKIEKLNADEGADIIFDEVLLIADEEGSDDAKVGAPFLKDVQVKAQVLKHARAKKIIVRKYKNKVRYRRKLGHRQHYTEVKILSVSN